MLLSFKDRDTPFSTAFSQLLIKLQVKSCKLIFAIVSVVFPSSPCSISVVFNMFAMFASVCLQLQTRHPSSACRIHPLARAPWTRKWKIDLCSTFRLQKCLCLIKYKCKEWITVPFEDLGTWGQLFVSMWQHLWQCHPAGTWAIHPKSWWIEVQNTYYMILTNHNWRHMKSNPSIIQITSSKAHFHDSPLRS